MQTVLEFVGSTCACICHPDDNTTEGSLDDSHRKPMAMPQTRKPDLDTEPMTLDQRTIQTPPEQPEPRDSSQDLIQLLTVQEVAGLLRVSQSLVYQLVDAGRIACHRIGIGRGAIRVSREEVIRFLATSRQHNGVE